QLGVEGEHDVVARLGRPQHVRGDLGAATVDLDLARAGVAEQGRLVGGLDAGDAHEVVHRVAGVAHGVRLLGVAHDLGREVRRVRALDALPEVEAGAAGDALLHRRHQLVGDVPDGDGAVLGLLGLPGVGRAQLALDAQEGLDALPLRRLPARVHQVVRDAVVGQHRAVAGQDATPERRDALLRQRVL